MIEDDLRKDDLPEDDRPVSAHLEDFDLPTFSEELSVWRTHCHELWNSAVLAGDLRSQASSLQAAFRGLAEWRDTLEAEKAAGAQAGISQETRDQIIRDHLDSLLRTAQTKQYAHCHCCHSSWGDVGRVRQFTEWLISKGLVDDFQQWLVGVAYITNEKNEDDHENRAN
jgi:hypothetical protein